MPFSRLIWLSAVVASAFPLGGCHNATEQDCDRIIDRIVELELKGQGITNPALVQQRKKDYRANMREHLLAGCVGNRIGKHAMACIDNAASPEEITEKCLQ